MLCIGVMFVVILASEAHRESFFGKIPDKPE